ncbi:Aminotran-1-2 domain-containing protein [Aphelenchoides besseyi]|nr:Aminotran-1-2 domain-containing protein [Aphelenchoides besseyi]KAI6200743.1 Aminotran-1-2 domain-containing protein [Aphelenchoides besseyi]
MAAPLNKKTECIYDLFGRLPHKLHVGTPPKEMLHKFAILFAEATQKQVEKEIESDDCLGGVLQYGFPVGNTEFRDSLAAFLSREYNSPVNRDNLVQTNGCTMALIFMLDQLFPKRTTIYVEKMTYFRTMAIFRAWHYDYKPIRIEKDGIDVEDLENVWSRDLKDANPSDENYSAVLYLMPQYHNPFGIVLSAEKSKRVVQLARKFNVLVICEDVYNFHYFDDIIHKRLFLFDDPQDPDYGKGHVVSSGTFSKIFMPSIRLGWVEANATVRRQAAHAHVELNRVDAKKKMQIAIDVLEKELPPSCRIFHRPKGGYFIYVLLPLEIDSTKACLILKEGYGIAVNDGKQAWTGNNNDDPDYYIANGIRICIPYLNAQHLEIAISEFCRCLTKLSTENGVSTRSAFIG